MSGTAIHTAAVLLCHLGLLIVGARLIVVDARTHRLPNRIVLPTAAVVLALQLGDAIVRADPSRLLRAIAGMLALGLLYAAMRAASRGGIGGGDVKLAAAIGLVLGWHGWQALLLGAAAAFVLGALFALVLMALRRVDRTTRIAFGPWMILGAIAGVVVSA